MSDDEQEQSRYEYAYLALDLFLNAEPDAAVLGMCPVYRSLEEAQEAHPDTEIVRMQFFDAFDA